jgi:hypothetical protein
VLTARSARSEAAALPVNGDSRNRSYPESIWCRLGLIMQLLKQ